MKRFRAKKMAIGLMVLSVGWVLGCMGQTPPASFYDLSVDAAMGSALRAGPSVSAVGIGPVRIPDALDRLQIVTRQSPQRLDVSEFHRWGSRLREALPRVVAENIAALMPGTPVVVLPWVGIGRPSHRVTLDVVRFDGNPGDQVILAVNWSIVTPGEDAQTVLRRSRIEEPVASDSYADYVAAQSRALSALSLEIARELASKP
ncbi:MAG: PqiC family protein [Desulfobacterales bacterium]